MGTCYCVCIGDLEKSDFVGKAEASYRNVEDCFRGKYLPLTVWGAQGYDTDKILQNCKDIIEDPVAGTCYCVNVGEKSDFQGKREEHKDMLTNGGSSAGNAADCQQQPLSTIFEALPPHALSLVAAAESLVESFVSAAVSAAAVSAAAVPPATGPVSAFIAGTRASAAVCAGTRAGARMRGGPGAASST